MSDIVNLKPEAVWRFFDEITRIPRPSKKEEKIVAYLIDFAKSRSLEYRKDSTGNVVIRKGASPGMENRPVVVLQSHVDMVCEKRGDVNFHFDTDPIRTRVEDGWMRAEGTTLGADCGIGMAAEGHLWEPDRNWGYVQFKTPAEVTEAYLRYTGMLLDMIPRGFSAGVYTQTSDVEIEVNGLMTYDRKKIKIDETKVREINQAICRSLEHKDKTARKQ